MSHVNNTPSGLFADLLAFQNDTSTSPIEINASSRALRSFLNAVYTQKMDDVTHKFKNLEQDGIELLALCDFVEAPSIKTLIMDRALPSTGRGMPWFACAQASQIGDVNQARQALRLVGRMVEEGNEKADFELEWMNEEYRSVSVFY